MGYYNDDYFIEYEELDSDSKRRPAQRRSGERPAPRTNTYNRNTAGRYSADRNISSRSSGSRPAYRSVDSSLDAYGFDNFDRDNSGRDRGSYAGRPPTANRGPSGDPRQRNLQQGRRDPGYRKRRKSRRFRRTMIVTVLVLIVLLLLTGIIAIAVSASGVGSVDDLRADEVSANQVALSWKEAGRADGYIVRMAQDGSDTFEDYLTINDPDTVTASVSELTQATAYRFSVTAFRGNKEGKPVVLDTVYTLPDTPEITNSFSAKKGTLHLDWTENDKASGYVVEYKKDGGEYSSEMTLTISDPAECKADIENLEENATYQARVYAFVSKDTTVNGAPCDEVSVKIVAEDTEVMPKAKDQKVNEAIDPDKPMIALTFDDGPAVDNDCGDRILDVLEKYNAQATFFMLGCNAGNCTDNLKRKVNLKMEIGNHTWNHTHYGNEVTADDIRKASNAFYDVCGQYSTCFRSPGGMTTQTILNECAAEGMAAYYWSIDTQDWSSRDADAVYHAVVDNVKDGDIVLMHEIYGSTADAVEKMVPELINQGYQLVTCHDLITLKTGHEPEPGVQYVDAFREMAP